MMLKWLLICVVAAAVAKWSQNVQANDELNLQEKRLLQELENEIQQIERKRDLDDCDSLDCFLDDNCAGECCEMVCGESSSDEEGCMDACMDGGLSVKKRMALAARKQEIANNEVNSNNNQHEKKVFGIRIPPIPPVRIPPVRRWVPPVRVPPVRIPPVRIPSIPPVRRWFGKK
ncbi:uncharacterized protein LOC132748140 [Ruditapes philippinarum]|uniref:uncharacterized protein LOC132748140 n=1 Tax=Ruditapes philippinarum TaxID=129788 RepID=UPI00295C38F4|nr:uncharacterized protein LOC132748140 [Ruditapes philippinarum]